MKIDGLVLARDLESIFRKYGNSYDAIAMQAYMKGNFLFCGIKSPLRKQLTDSFYTANKSDLANNLIEFVDSCWKSTFREIQYAALDILRKMQKHLKEENIEELENWICTKSWWDTVDFLASNIAGYLIKTYPESLNDRPDQWIASNNMWLNRTAIIYQLKYANDMDEDRLFKYVLGTIGSKEFFINKATGWALRQYSKFESDAVKTFVEDNPDLSNLTKREALKLL